jgi:hypothetical protein
LVWDVIKMDEGQLQQHLDRLMRSMVERTLHELLDAEPDQLYGVQRYQRSPERVYTLAGSYTRTLQTRRKKWIYGCHGSVNSLRDADHRTLPPQRAVGGGDLTVTDHAGGAAPDADGRQLPRRGVSTRAGGGRGCDTSPGPNGARAAA